MSFEMVIPALAFRTADTGQHWTRVALPDLS